MSRITWNTGELALCPICEGVYGECKHNYKDLEQQNKELKEKLKLNKKLYDWLSLNFVNSCTVCGGADGFLLFADYGASGLWCKKCGVSFGDIEKDYPHIPEELISLLGTWVGFWQEYADEENKYNYEFLHNMYVKAGQYLATLFNEYLFNCTFEDR